MEGQNRTGIAPRSGLQQEGATSEIDTREEERRQGRSRKGGNTTDHPPFSTAAELHRGFRAQQGLGHAGLGAISPYMQSVQLAAQSVCIDTSGYLSCSAPQQVSSAYRVFRVSVAAQDGLPQNQVDVVSAAMAAESVFKDTVFTDKHYTASSCNTPIEERCDAPAGSVVTFSHPDRVSSYHAASWMHRQKYRVPPPPRCRRCCWPVDFNTPDRSSSGSSSGSPRMPRLRAQKTKTLLSSNDAIFPKFGRGPGSVRKQP